MKLGKALSAAESYRERIAALGPLDPARVEELARFLDSADKASSPVNPGGLQSDRMRGEDPAADSGMGIEAVRGLLRAAGIRGERLRFSGKEGAQTKLALRCETVKFFEFLSGLPGRGKVPVNYLSICAVPGSREADIVMRFNYE